MPRQRWACSSPRNAEIRGAPAVSDRTARARCRACTPRFARKAERQRASAPLSRNPAHDVHAAMRRPVTAASQAPGRQPPPHSRIQSATSARAWRRAISPPLALKWRSQSKPCIASSQAALAPGGAHTGPVGEAVSWPAKR